MKNTKLTYEDFKRIKELEHEADSLKTFASVDGDKIEICYWSWVSCKYFGYRIDNKQVIDAAKEEAKRQYSLIREQINLIKELSRKEDEKKQIIITQTNIQLNNNVLINASPQDVEGSASSIIRRIITLWKEKRNAAASDALKSS